ncbi:MAG: hypothetical protein ABIR33_00880 [Pyrinomonadaceae bacterium]
MKQRVLFFLCVLVGCVGFAAAQGKTVTNADLEKFKQKRMQADQELKQYYAKLGLSEEDVAKQEAANAKDRAELSARLRALRLEEERLQSEARQREIEARGSTVNVVVPSDSLGYPGYFTNTNPYFGRRGRWVRPTRFPVTYRATPVGIIYEPGGRPASIYSPTIPQRQGPAWRTVRRPR